MSLRVDVDKHFISFVAHTVNYKQLEETLYEVDESQFIVLREIALNIISIPGVIYLTVNTRKHLEPYWKTLEQLAAGDFTRKRLKENAFLIAEICRLTLHYYCTQLQKNTLT